MTDSRRALTKTERVQEIIKCGKDPIYFINTYVKIQHPTRGRIPFETYDFQDDIINDINNHRFNIVLKSRQLGISTIAASYAVWYAIFHKDKNILVIATKLKTAQNFVKKVLIALKSLPPWLLLPKYEESMTELRFDNGSQIVASPTSEDAGRSEALSLLIIDEAAFIRNFEDIWTGLSPTISTGGRVLALSTPNGVGGMYYKLWTDAVAGQNEFNTIYLPWTVHPEHDQDWFNKETRNITQRKVAQEFLCDFIASGDTFLDISDLNWLKDNVAEPIEKLGFDRNVWVWKRPEAGARYVLSADVARGDRGDYSTFHIINYDECDVVVEYMAKIPPDDLARMINEFGRKYNNALVIPENNTFGYHTCTMLRDQLAYPKMWNKSHRGDPMTCFTDMNELPGFTTQGNTRPLILTKLEELIRNRTLRTYSQRTIDEFQSFVWNNGKAMASRDSHDDLVMSLAIGAWICGGAYALTDVAAASSMAMLRATGKLTRNQNDLVGGIQDVKPLVDPNIKGMNPQSLHRPRDPSAITHTDVSDFSWLLD